MKIFIQFGNKGASLFDHLIGPLSGVNDLTKIIVVCRYPGPAIPKVEYRCPPGFVRKFAFIAAVYEFIDLFFLALFSGPGYMVGYLLNPHGIIAFIVGKLTGKPIIVSLIAGPFELYSRRRPLGVDFTKPLPWSGRLLLKLIKNSDAVITTGSFTRNFLLKHGIEESRIYPMINPPNKSRFRFSDVPKTFDVISVGRLVPVKHHEIMIRVISMVKGKYPNIKAGIVGDGPFKDELIKLAHGLGLKENMVFTGFQKDITYLYNSSRVFMLTSEREGFPNVVLEAMMCGLPCVVSNCGDIIDVVRNGNNSFVIEDFNDIEGFARAIVSLLENKELYHEISQNALKTAKSLSAGEITNQWELIFKRIKSHA
jgi:glycosyltransferase involved in cell wall biosynthesis